MTAQNLKLGHKFKVGEIVDYSAMRGGVAASGTGYKIVRILPIERGQKLYRIKTLSESFERVAKEGELEPRPLS